MSGPTIVSEFAETGVVRLDAAFPRTAAEQIGNAVWGYAERKAGLRRDDPTSWPDEPFGFSWKRLRRNQAFNALTDNDAVRTALDVVFGPSQWLEPKPGAQVLLMLPRPGMWVLPQAWHMDCGFEQPSWPVCWNQTPVVACARREAVRLLRRGGAERRWHDAVARNPSGGRRVPTQPPARHG